MLNVIIIGTGNVAQHLFDAFSASAGTNIVQVVGRSKQALANFKNSAITLTDFKNIAEADVYIIAVSDMAIPTVSKHLLKFKGLVVHTSGSVSIDVLINHSRYGVFYPLQTFTKDRKVAINCVPFCLETHNEADMDLLKKLTGQLSQTMYDVNSEQRKMLHLAAVFVNNFTNHLFHIGKEICYENGLPFEILQPLLQETLDKTQQLTPFDAQTGPARRGDFETIERHLEELKNSGHNNVYEVMSKSIRNLYPLDANYTEQP